MSDLRSFPKTPGRVSPDAPIPGSSCALPARLHPTLADRSPPSGELVHRDARRGSLIAKKSPFWLKADRYGFDGDFIPAKFALLDGCAFSTRAPSDGESNLVDD